MKMTPMAPASCSQRAFAANMQSPRRARAMWPLRSTALSIGPHAVQGEAFTMLPFTCSTRVCVNASWWLHLKRKSVQMFPKKDICHHLFLDKTGNISVVLEKWRENIEVFFVFVIMIQHLFLIKAIQLAGSFDVDPVYYIIVTSETHPVLLLGEVHSKLGRSRGEDCPTQKRGGYELNNMRNHFLFLWCLAHLCHKFNPVHSFMLLQRFIF